MFDTSLLKDKTILVTGGGSGLGLAMADKFAELGAGVAICGRRQEKLDKAAEELKKHGNPVYTYSVDVRDYDAVGEMVASLVQDAGGVYGLVNNAAGNFLSASETLSPNAFRSIIDIVLMGTFNCTSHVGKWLIDNEKPGSVINIVTTYTQTGSAFVMPSACAKAGVEAMTKSLAYEWATYNIRLNAIAPGPFPTKGAWSRLMPDPKMEEFYMKRIPTRRHGKHEELANLAAFLISEASPYITGDTVTIDGGEKLQGQFSFLDQIVPRDKLKMAFNMMRPPKK